ncbi:MAG: hypothetical protein WBW92_13480, partial [Rhodanobacteraceae bacterium]
AADSLVVILGRSAGSNPDAEAGMTKANIGDADGPKGERHDAVSKSIEGLHVHWIGLRGRGVRGGIGTFALRYLRTNGEVTQLRGESFFIPRLLC